MENVAAILGLKPSGALSFALTVAGLLVLGAFWQWVLIDWLTPFLFLIVAFIGIGLLCLSVVVSALAFISRLRNRQGLDLSPLVVNVITVLVLLFVPFTSLWLDANYHWHRAGRLEVVEQIRSGVLKPNVADNTTLVTVQVHRALSCGGEAVVRQGPEGTYVLFYTFRGILDHYSGFLYVPEGGSPQWYVEACGDHFIEITSMGPHWYFMAAA